MWVLHHQVWANEVTTETTTGSLKWFLYVCLVRENRLQQVDPNIRWIMLKWKPGGFHAMTWELRMLRAAEENSLHLRESVEGTVSVLGTTKPTNEVRRSLLGRGTYHITRCRRRLWSHGRAVSFREARLSFFIIIQLGPLAIQPPKTQPQPQNLSDKLAFYAGLQWCACLKWHSSAIKMTPFLADARPVWQWQLTIFKSMVSKNDRYFITNLANWAMCQLNLMCLLGLQYDFWALLLGVLTMSTVFFQCSGRALTGQTLGC